jgi:O-antigen/teichoic acid export membrane protein
MLAVLLKFLATVLTYLMATGHLLYVVYTIYQSVYGLYLAWVYRHKFRKFVRFVFHYRTRFLRNSLRKALRLFRKNRS